MTDLYIDHTGDIAVSPSGDLALTLTTWRNDVQQAYVRLMTDEGDFLLYPELGATLSKLWGMPQSPATGQYGSALIASALDREGRFIGKKIQINPVPTGQQSIRFDVFITSGSREQVRLSVEQSLGAGVSGDYDIGDYYDEGIPFD
jgi:hypothetical protein